MKRRWIEYTESYEPGPMSYWVLRHLDSDDWHTATQFDPPLPRPVPGQGFARYFVECDGFTFVFASLEEVRHCIDILSQKRLPRSLDLARKRGSDLVNQHWLSRSPDNVKPWRYREKATKYLHKALVEFERATT